LKPQRVYKIGDTFISISAFKSMRIKNIDNLVENILNLSKVVWIQGVNAMVIYGFEHIIETLKITLESERRRALLAKKPQVDFLLRLVCTNQISNALQYGGLKDGRDGCFIACSKNEGQLLKVSDRLHYLFGRRDETILKPTEIKRKTISERLGIGINNNPLKEDIGFLEFLAERGALITR